MALDITGLGAVSDLATTVINKIWPDKAEALSPSVFVAGWRPAIGWVCGVACAWNWIALPMVKVALAVSGYQLALSPAEITEMLPILMGMLGLGGLRNVEKVKWGGGKVKPSMNLKVGMP